MALARGAALASAHNPEYTFDEFDQADDDDRARRRSLPLPYSAALGMLAVGVLTFVVSIAFAAGLRLTSNNGPEAATPEQRPTATQPASQPVAEAVPPVVTPPAVIAPPSPEATAEREFVPPLPAP